VPLRETWTKRFSPHEDHFVRPRDQATIARIFRFRGTGQECTGEIVFSACANFLRKQCRKELAFPEADFRATLAPQCLK
jgi:hypothetical protein